MTDTWERDTKLVGATFNRRFPELVCLRCQGKQFALRVYPDASLVPAYSALGDNNIAELICDSCGFMERHVIGRLVNGDR